jgi:hypothetical protein
VVVACWFMSKITSLDTIVNKLKQVKSDYGAECIVLAQGTSREYESFLFRFANLLGTPNVLGAGHMCYLSRVATSLIICGKLPVVDYDGKTRSVSWYGETT